VGGAEHEGDRGAVEVAVAGEHSELQPADRTAMKKGDWPRGWRED
jgi:hypothetical protein